MFTLLQTRHWAKNSWKFIDYLLNLPYTLEAYFAYKNHKGYVKVELCNLTVHKMGNICTELVLTTFHSWVNGFFIDEMLGVFAMRELGWISQKKCMPYAWNLCSAPILFAQIYSNLASCSCALRSNYSIFNQIWVRFMLCAQLLWNPPLLW
jgi:hypothetical protein